MSFDEMVDEQIRKDGAPRLKDPNAARKFALEMAIRALPASGPAQQCEQAEKYYQWLSAKWCRLER